MADTWAVKSKPTPSYPSPNEQGQKSSGTQKTKNRNITVKRDNGPSAAERAQAKAVADAKAQRDAQARIAAAERAQADKVAAKKAADKAAAEAASARQSRDRQTAAIAAKKAADKAAADRAAADKAAAEAASARQSRDRQTAAIAAKKAADKAAADRAAADKAAEDKAIEEESQRMLAESARINAEIKRKAEANAIKLQQDKEREIFVKEKRERDGISVNSTLTESTAAAPVAEVETTSKGLINSFIPDVISESLKGEGNYSPEWVEKNKAAGSKHLESLYASGQLQRPLSNVTDASGNAIGGVANSQDNVAMQEMAANGVADPQTALTKKVSDEAGLDTSFSGAFRQAVNGADGHEYEGGSGLLNYANDNAPDDLSVDGVSQGTVDRGVADAAARRENLLESVKGPDGEDIPVEDLSSNYIDITKFSGNLGFDTLMEAQTYWDSMTPEAQAIFNSKERPELSDKILTGVFGLMIPGFGLLNKFMYNDNMSLQEKLEFSDKTAVTVANNKDQMKNNSGSNDNSGGGTALAAVGAAPAAEDASEYANLDSYLSVFNNYKF